MGRVFKFPQAPLQYSCHISAENPQYCLAPSFPQFFDGQGWYGHVHVIFIGRQGGNWMYLSLTYCLHEVVISASVTTCRYFLHLLISTNSSLEYNVINNCNIFLSQEHGKLVIRFDLYPISVCKFPCVFYDTICDQIIVQAVI